MATCEVCANEYDKSFELIAAGTRHISTASNVPSRPWPRSAASRTSWLMKSFRNLQLTTRTTYQKSRCGAKVAKVPGAMRPTQWRAGARALNNYGVVTSS
jgi:hypothetical protein